MTGLSPGPSLLASTISFLDSAGVELCLIGAAALAVHGVSRATQDVDVFAIDRRVLRTAFWQDFDAAPTDVRVGDATDPLRGLVRIERDHEVVDVVVGHGGEWQRDAIASATVQRYLDASLPVATPVALARLKLYAGGPRDFWDLDLLLATHPGLRTTLEAEHDGWPAVLRRAWARFRTQRGE